MLVFRMTQNVHEDLITILPRLRRFAYSLCGSLDDADDLVQAACERALARLHQYTPGSRLDSWMFRIVQTTWIDLLRANKRRNVVNDPEAIEMIAVDTRIAEGAEARRDLEIVQAETERLPEEQRLVLSLVAVEGLSYQEAADLLEVPIGTIMSRLSRARKKLAAAIERGSSAEPIARPV